MKNLLLFALFILLFKSSKCQLNATIDMGKNPTADNLFKQARDFNTAAWLILVAGSVTTITGLASYPREIFYSNEADKKKAARADNVCIAGAILILGSVPCFITGAIKTHKARLAIKSQNTGLGLPPKIPKAITTLSLSINLGR